MRMGHDGQGDRPGAMALEKRRDDPAPGIGAAIGGPGIDENLAAARRAERRRVALADVQKM
jgi:hypothetical protein